MHCSVMHKTADFNPEMSLTMVILKEAHWRLLGTIKKISKFVTILPEVS